MDGVTIKSISDLLKYKTSLKYCFIKSIDNAIKLGFSKIFLVLNSNILEDRDFIKQLLKRNKKIYLYIIPDLDENFCKTPSFIKIKLLRLLFINSICKKLLPNKLYFALSNKTGSQKKFKKQLSVLSFFKKKVHSILIVAGFGIKNFSQVESLTHVSNYIVICTKILQLLTSDIHKVFLFLKNAKTKVNKIRKKKIINL
ncbi:hypothetical protein ACWNYH_00295 [Candidatus Vidania fulgoroideorum]